MPTDVNKNTRFGWTLKAARSLLSIVVGSALSLGLQTESSFAKTVLDLQMHETVQKLTLPEQRLQILLTELNSHYKKWYLLEFKNLNGGLLHSFHLENPYPDDQQIELSTEFTSGLVFKGGSFDISNRCALWDKGRPEKLVEANRQIKPFVEMCNGRLFVRNTIDGYMTTKEWVVEFLRDKVWGGESITTFVKNTVYKDKFLIEAAMSPFSQTPPEGSADQAIGTPPVADLAPGSKGLLIEPEELGLRLERTEKGGNVFVGRWYEVKDQSGMFVSVIRPSDVDGKIIQSFPDRVNVLDSVESSAVVYLAAIDIGMFDMHFALGTEHPRLDWSFRAQSGVRTNAPGPDGFDNAGPLVRTGLINPIDRKRVVVTFTGGFKRDHSAFRAGTFAATNNGSHYGFVESGVVFSRMIPGLSTIVIDRSGKVTVKTWEDHDDVDRLEVRYARQNGVPIIEWDSARGAGIPGQFVKDWQLGNWSGNEHAQQRTLRAGMCAKNYHGKNFLIYGYFSSVTPNAMARVFQSYRCDYAIHMDMNALEHTYFARYVSKPGDPAKYPEHLVKGMSILDERFKGNVPRFIGYPDNRDFFYLLKK